MTWPYLPRGAHTTLVIRTANKSKTKIKWSEKTIVMISIARSEADFSLRETPVPPLWGPLA